MKPGFIVAVERAGMQAAKAGQPRKPPYNTRNGNWANYAWLRGYDSVKVKK
jgi:hypothetical protein